jgi:hypothetical protein
VGSTCAQGHEGVEGEGDEGGGGSAWGWGGSEGEGEMKEQRVVELSMWGIGVSSRSTSRDGDFKRLREGEM